MEERIIDDEYGRGVRMKKTNDGYVDVTDELAQDNDLQNDDVADEVAFEFPVLDTDEDDEDLVGLSPAEALALRKKKEEEEAARFAEYQRLCAEGDALLETGSFHAAELKFEKALALDKEAVDASVGYWRAKTNDFANPDVLVGEYAEASIESLEFDLGYKATDIIREKYRATFEKRFKELTEEEKPLAEEVETKQARRRQILKKRIKKSAIFAAVAALPTIVLLILTIVVGLKNFEVRGSEYVLPTIALGVGFFITFVAFLLLANKFINDMRMRKANDDLSATDAGAKLVQIRDYKEIYARLLDGGVSADE